jgi:L-fuconolactonase
VTRVRIDAHHHVWESPGAWADPFPVLQKSYGYELLTIALTEAGIDGTVVVQSEDSAEETAALLSLAAREPRVLGVVGWTPPESPGLTALRELPGGEFLKGIRWNLQSEPDPDYLYRPETRAALAGIGRHGMVFDLVVRPHQLPAVLAAVRAVPGTRFVLDHAGKPDLTGELAAEWIRLIGDLAALPNLAVKLSGLVTEADWDHWTADELRPVVDVLLAGFGPERTMFGSDWPVCLLAASYAEVLDPILKMVPDPVLGRTAATWYGLEVPA